VPTTYRQAAHIGKYNLSAVVQNGLALCDGDGEKLIMLAGGKWDFFLWMISLKKLPWSRL